MTLERLAWYEKKKIGRRKKKKEQLMAYCKALCMWARRAKAILFALAAKYKRRTPTRSDMTPAYDVTH